MTWSFLKQLLYERSGCDRRSGRRLSGDRHRSRLLHVWLCGMSHANRRLRALQQLHPYWSESLQRSHSHTRLILENLRCYGL